MKNKHTGLKEEVSVSLSEKINNSKEDYLVAKNVKKKVINYSTFAA
jgi:hypothetical protein